MSKKNKKLWTAAWLAACATWAGAARADELQEETWNAKFQTTYIWQTKPSFNAAYSGQNSLKTGHEKAYSFSATAALGWRPWNGTELYLDPEILQGAPLSNLTGLAGLTNAEQQKSSGPNPVLYRARLFLRQIVLPLLGLSARLLRNSKSRYPSRLTLAISCIAMQNRASPPPLRMRPNWKQSITRPSDPMLRSLRGRAGQHSPR